MFVVAALGAITAAIAFEGRAPRHLEPEPAPSHVSIVPKAAEESARGSDLRLDPPKRTYEITLVRGPFSPLGPLLIG
jgi:hypothetical protein